jgi:hypothetical protein
LSRSSEAENLLAPFTASQLVWWFILPLAAAYPSVAAVACRLARSPLPVLAIASLAPAVVYAVRIIQGELPTNQSGQMSLGPREFALRFGAPATTKGATGRQAPAENTSS